MSQQYDAKIGKQLTGKFHQLLSLNPSYQIFSFSNRGIDMASYRSLVLGVIHEWRMSQDSSLALQLLATKSTYSKTVLSQPNRCYIFAVPLPIQRREIPAMFVRSVLASTFMNCFSWAVLYELNRILKLIHSAPRQYYRKLSIQTLQKTLEKRYCYRSEIIVLDCCEVLFV